MNIKTGLVSPQYHIMYDDHFMTTQSLVTNVLPSNWKSLFQKHSENVQLDNPFLRDSHTLGHEWGSTTPAATLDLDSGLSPTESNASNSWIPYSEGETHIPLSEGVAITNPLEGAAAIHP